jgi:hypothetical protein
MPLPERVAPFAQNIHHDTYHAISSDGALSNSDAGLMMVIIRIGKGIGCAPALTFAKAREKVAILAARSTHELAEVEVTIGKTAPRTKLVKVVTDVTDEESVKTLFESVEEVNGV